MSPGDRNAPVTGGSDGWIPYDVSRHPFYGVRLPAPRELYSDAQLTAGSELACLVLTHGRYSYGDARQIVRCYVEHTPTH